MNSKDPYTNRLVSNNAYADKCDITGQVVAVLRGSVEKRGLQLIPQPSRAVKKDEIHELIITDEKASPGDTVQRIAYLAFVMFTSGGVLLQGDQLFVNHRLVGLLAGYDLCHFPNHMNIVFNGERISGEDRGFTVGSKVLFKHVKSV
jgi:hypothetical protein